MRNFARRLSEFFTGEKGKRVIIAAGLAVIALLFLSSVIPKKEETESVIGYETAEQAERRLEQRLEALIAKIDGAGSATVMVTLDTTAERVYAQNEKTGTSQNGNGESGSRSGNSETEIVLAGSARQPLESGAVMPKARGCAVVCAGAADPAVKERIANAVADVLGIGISRVYVTC